MPANASQKNLRPQEIVRNSRTEAPFAKNAADDRNKKSNVTIKDQKNMIGREKTEIRVSGIRLDKEQLFEIENKEEKNCNC